MGDWYVLANIPTYFEKDATNCIERYVWNAARNLVEINFYYKPKNTSATNSSSSSRKLNLNIKDMTTTRMHGMITEQNTKWLLNPKIGIYWAFNLSYLILDLADDYSYVMIGVPDRSYLWIMTRKVPISTVAREEKYMTTEGVLQKANEEIKVDNGVFVVQGNLSNVPAVGSEELEQSNENNSNIRLSLEMETNIMDRAYKKASELGYDCSKIQRVIWE